MVDCAVICTFVPVKMTNVPKCLQGVCLDGLRCVNRLASPRDPVPYVLLRPRFARKCDGMLTLCGTIPIAVTQISNIKRQKVRLEAPKKEAEDERERVREAARERVLREFEKG